VIDRIYCHIVWTTRRREALIDAGLARFLCGFFRGIASQEGARILEIGMVGTHLHLLVRIRPTTSVSRLLQRLKGGSAAVAGKKRRAAEGMPLKWAKGYSIHSVTGSPLVESRLKPRLGPAAEAAVHWSVH